MLEATWKIQSLWIVSIPPRSFTIISSLVVNSKSGEPQVSSLFKFQLTPTGKKSITEDAIFYKTYFYTILTITIKMVNTIQICGQIYSLENEWI